VSEATSAANVSCTEGSQSFIVWTLESGLAVARAHI
jgi:hypothetical protein